MFLVGLGSREVASFPNCGSSLGIVGNSSAALSPATLPQASLLQLALGSMECLRIGLPRELLPHPEISFKMEKVNRALKLSHYTIPSLTLCPLPEAWFRLK